MNIDKKLKLKREIKLLLNAVQILQVFANGLRDRGSIPGRIKPKTQNMVLDTTLINTGL